MNIIGYIGMTLVTISAVLVLWFVLKKINKEEIDL